MSSNCLFLGLVLYFMCNIVVRGLSLWRVCNHLARVLRFPKCRNILKYTFVPYIHIVL